ncbi:MAG: ATP-binding protein [Cyanobacteria bacterium P01_D01_bin.105]
MQTSEYIIAYQTVSLSAYQRLRETLLQQAQAFDTVEQTENFILMHSEALTVLLTAARIGEGYQAEHPSHQAEHSSHRSGGEKAVAEKAANNASPEDAAIQYRVGLTFDARAIAVFTQRLRKHQQKNHYRAEQAHAAYHLSNPLPNHTLSSVGHNAEKVGRSSQQPISDEDRLIAQKSFVLGWAKNLAVSPEGDVQPSQTDLDNQLQQSLLLDQVITRIRHSLDLPAILETTVAQVREFLSADRLVLYQFDQFELIGEAPAENRPDENRPAEEMLSQRSPHTSAPQSSTEEAAMLNTLDANGHVPSGRVSSHSAESNSAESSSSFPDSSVNVGRSAYSGHVTYESRVSDDIPTVLHLSERECFSPFQSQRHARYLLGQPIAIDNVDETYTNTACLLNFLRQANVKSKIIAPIIVQDRLWGLLIAHQCHTYRHWEKSEAVFLQHIAEHLAVAISQASLYQQLRQQTVSLESCVIERTQSLHDALIAAESANITKDEFLSTMSHELRTPLTYIIGMSATLLRWSLGELNERQRSYLKTINQSGEQLLKVINDILEFASVESGRSLLNASALPLGSFIHQVVASYQPMANQQEVKLSLSVETPDDDYIEADAKRLQQIIGNLIHNAIKFTGAGGQVNVRVWRELQAVILQVQDTGIGIPESQRDELFEKFKQLESPFQRQYSGTGLGLAMTKHLVELHGGKIQVQSKVAEGSTFTVRLPAHSELTGTSEKRPQSLETALGATNPKRVVLLEENENNAAIAFEMLTAAGYEVIWLVEADQLADQLGSLKPALLIADLSLLRLDPGNIKTIQHTITALNTKVLAISTEQAFTPSAMAHHDILHKPLDPKALLGKVKQLA